MFDQRGVEVPLLLARRADDVQISPRNRPFSESIDGRLGSAGIPGGAEVDEPRPVVRRRRLGQFRHPLERGVEGGERVVVLLVGVEAFALETGEQVPAAESASRQRAARSSR
jgi:hypothetical protein